MNKDLERKIEYLCEFKPYDEATEAIMSLIVEELKSLVEKTGYTIIDTLTNGNYINGVDAVDISNKVVDQLKAHLTTGGGENK